MKISLEQAIPFAEAFEKLLHPFAEVALHDLKTDKVVAIYNSFSRRIVGDESYLDRINLDEGKLVIGPYDKTNWDGRPLKCVSIILKNEDGKAEGLLCVNMDVSQFEKFQTILGSFLSTEGMTDADEQTLFKDDLYEQVNSFVQEYCRKNQVSLEALNRDQKKELVQKLEKRGAFNGSKASTYIGRVLKISRATVYNYLKEKE